jgi:oxalate decarboxylase
MSIFQRRDFLTRATAFAAGATAMLVRTRQAAADDKPPQLVRGQKGASIIGPTNAAREAQNVDRLAPPPTDHGTMPNLRFSFADVHNRLQPGGWARQVTGRELQIAQALNCVNMRLKAGAVREMHWHVPDEWGFVLKGRMRITAVDQDGHAFQDDINEGNIWNFPGGIPHSLQGMEGDGCEFLLVFNDGNFNEDATFLVTDFLAHIPKEVLAKNFGVPKSAFANIPKEELYIFESQVPGPIAADRVVGAGPVPSSYSHGLMDQEPIRTKGGRVRIVDSSNFSAAKEIAAALVEVEPGGMRELHWHPNSDELQYYIAGQSRMTVYASGGAAGTFDYQPGDVGYVPRSMPHYVENTGTTTLRYLELWQSDHFADVSLRQWLAFTPNELVKAHLNIDKSVLAQIPTHKTPVVPA